MRKIPKPLTLLLLVFLVSCREGEPDSGSGRSPIVRTPATPPPSEPLPPAEELSWDGLVPAGYDARSVGDRFHSRAQKLTDTGPGSRELFQEILAELESAPLESALEGKHIKIHGFVVPLKTQADKVTEFLLMPFFGECIHVPPPPVNQTVLVKTDSNNGISAEQSYLPVWITGVIHLDKHRTDLGLAGYRVENAKIEPYRF